jgi:hypothetical protein
MPRLSRQTRRRCRRPRSRVALLSRRGRSTRRHRGFVPWSQLRTEVLALYEPPSAQPATLRQMSQVCRELDALGLEWASDLDDQAIARWIAAHKDDPRRGPQRAESLLRCIRRIVTIAKRKRYIQVNPFKVKTFGTWINAKAQPKRRGRLSKSREEIQAIREAAGRRALTGTWRDKRARVFTEILTFTAFRSDTARHILARNVDLVNRTIKIEPHGKWRPKTIGTGRTYAIDEPLVSILAEWLPICGADPFAPRDSQTGVWLLPGRPGRNGKAWKGSQNYMPIDYVRAIAREAGVGDMTAIGFRKSLGTNAKVMGLSGLERRELLGHSDEKTGESYDDERVETMRPAVAKIVSFYAPARAPAQAQA